MTHETLSRTRLLTAAVIALAATLLAPLASAAEARWQEGTHYQALPIPVGDEGDGIVVTEFFSYACVHCFQFDGELESWLEDAPDDVRFERVPAVFSRPWLLFAQAYYVARSCDVLEQTHIPFFRAIHLDRRSFRSPDDVAAFYEETVDGTVGQCSSKQDFLDVFDSFAVGAAVQQSVARGRAYKANGVPTMIVDGTWRTDGRSAGSNAGMLEVVEHLVSRARVMRTAGEPASQANAGN